MLDDRITVAPLEIDYERADGDVLVTPVRQTMGKGSPNACTAKFAETELVERINDKRVKEQVKAVAEARSLARSSTLPFVFQRDDGSWFENRVWPRLNADLKDKLRERLETDTRFLREQIKGGDIILIECPEADRRLRMLSWTSWYGNKIAGFEGLNMHDIFKLRPEDVATGACEFVARIAKELPTYFDHIYGIEIAAQNEIDESFNFIPLFPDKTRVPGNREFKERLEGRFAVQPGSLALSFHLWRQDDPAHVRRSKTDLDLSPSRRVPITLEVTQRPVSGYATVEVLPEIDGALGRRRIVLDWEKMELDEKSREEVIAELDRNLPAAFPNHAPTLTHSIAWEIIDPRPIIRKYLSTLALSSSFESVVTDLRDALRNRISNPSYFGVVNIDRPVYLFNSDGDIATEISGDRNNNAADLVAKLRAKITADIEALGGARAWRSKAGMPKAISALLLAGCWMYAKAPDACLAYLRDVFGGRATIGRRIESIGRAVASDEDIRAALKWLMDRLRAKEKGVPAKAQLRITPELKAVSTIIQYRESSFRFFDAKDATDLVRYALMNLETELQAKNNNQRPKDLQFSFLYAATVFLLALRYRKKDARFLEPPAKDDKPSQAYASADKTLTRALETIEEDKRHTRRAIHRLVPEVISDAIEFLHKTGGNPDIIVAIDRAAADDVRNEDEE
jgi:hypothetical protein